jgi:LacI family transcriptional regulator
MVTIRDVARAAGVGVGTASRALNGSGPVSAAVRARVQTAAETLGFVPNRAAQTLITGRSLALGVILPDLTNPYFPVMAHGIADAARTAGYATILLDASWDPAREREAVELLRRQRVDAAILPVGTQTAALARTLLAARIPVVLLDRDPHALGVPQVAVDDEQGERDALAWARQRGHTHIGFLAGPRGIPAADRRLRAYLDATGHAALPLDAAETRADLPIARADFDFELGRHAAAALLRCYPALTCLVAANDLSALGALAHLTAAGIPVPQECAVIGFDDIPAASLVYPALTTVRQPAYAVGAEAARLALDLLRAPPRDQSVACRVFPAELVVRDSC